MRVVVVGATGNVGTSLVRALADEPAVDAVLGVARRLPELSLPKVEWAAADVVRDDLVPLFRGADCVVHLAWLIQPSHDENALWLTNVHGSQRLFRAVGDAGVHALVYASSVGAYAEGPKDRRVDESWPAAGIGTSSYSRHKAEAERWLDEFEREHPEVRVARLRPGLIFKRESATEQRRLFAGPFVPGSLLRPGLVPFVPDHPRLRFQAVHSYDVGDAYRLAICRDDARGAFNVAAEPVVTPAELASLLGARRVPVPRQLLRGGAWLTWHLRLQPSDVGWVDLGLGVPLMDVTRLRELGWQPRHSSVDALRDLLAGLREGAGHPTPPLDARSSAGELVTSHFGHPGRSGVTRV